MTKCGHNKSMMSMVDIQLHLIEVMEIIYRLMLELIE